MVGSLLILPAKSLLALLHRVVEEWHLRHAHSLSRLTLPAVLHPHHGLLLLLLRLLRMHHRVDVAIVRLLRWHWCRHGLCNPGPLGQHRRLTRGSSDRHRRG